MISETLTSSRKLNELKTLLTSLFNLWLRTGIFPDKLKIAKVSPVFESGEKRSFN